MSKIGRPPVPLDVKILGHRYFVQLEENQLMKTGGSPGNCNNHMQLITIAEELSFSSQMEILFHEVIEALNYRLELNLEHWKICVLGEALFQFVSENYRMLGEVAGGE